MTQVVINQENEDQEELVAVTEQGMFGDLQGDFEIDDPTARSIKK